MINFFDAKYLTEPARKDGLFGICDDGKLAYTTTAGEPMEWVAVVTNKDNHQLQFVPIDHNIIVKNKDGNERSQCDGMLYSVDNAWLIFVELKEVRKGWHSKPLEQLEATIQLFLQNHDYTLYSKRFAYAINRKHPNFAYSRKEEMQTFHNRYKFRLLFQRCINIK